MAIDKEERYSRQKDLVPVDKLIGTKVTVIGVGAIGRQVALQLAAMGVPELELVDFDVVEDGNLAAQGFMESDLGKQKVDAVAELCKQINSEIKVITHNCRYSRSMKPGGVVFCCVDKIDTRSFLWEFLSKKDLLWIDGRMSAEVVRILVSYDKETVKYYTSTLFRAEEAFTGSCTAKTTIYSSNVAAGIMVCQMAKFLRHMPMDVDISLNLLTNELDAKDIAAAKKAATSVTTEEIND